MAIRCVTNRFIADIERYDTLSHVAIFGAPGWEALKTISIGGLTVLERLAGARPDGAQFPALRTELSATNHISAGA